MSLTPQSSNSINAPRRLEVAVEYFAFVLKQSAPSFTVEYYQPLAIAVASSSDIGISTDWLQTVDYFKLSLRVPHC